MKITLASLLVLGMALIGCGTSSKNGGNINGNWTATLMDSHNTQAFAFKTSIVESTNGSLSISNFGFNTNSPCFVSGETESGSFALSGDFNGNVAGKFGMNVLSGSPGGNNLTLSGAVAGNTITGTWALTGSSGCTGNGTFTMSRV